MPDETPTHNDTPHTVGSQAIYGGALKSVGGGKVAGYVAYFRKPGDSPDLQGEWFTKSTDFCLNQYPITNQAFVLYQHGQDATVGNMNHGVPVKAFVDDVGLWAEAQLDLANRFTEAIEKLIASGKFYWSSGSVPQLTQVKGGEILRWPVAEISITYSPAQPLTTRILPVKAIAQDAPSLKDLLTGEEADDDSAAPNAAVSHPLIEAADAPELSDRPTRGVSDMDITKLTALIAKELGVTELTAEELMRIAEVVTASMAPEAEAIAEADPMLMEGESPEAKAVQKSVDTISAALAERIRVAVAAKSGSIFAGAAKRAASHDARSTPSNSVRANGISLPAQPAGFGAPAIIEDMRTKSRWSNIDPRAASMALHVTQELFNTRHMGTFFPGGSEAGLESVKQIIAAGALELSGKSLPTNARQDERSRSVRLNYGEQQFMKSVVAGKANELDHTGQSSYGQDWVWTFWQEQIMDQARRENVVMSNLPNVDMPADVMELPVSWSDPEVYFAPESTELADLDPSTSNITSSKVGTSKMTLNAKKFGVRVAWSSELDEDSIVRFADVAQQQATRSIQNALDYVVMNGDTTNSSSNINDDVGSIAADTKFLALDGLRHLALVTTTANVVNGGGDAITYADLVDARFKLPREASADRGGIVYFANPELEAYLLRVPEFMTLDKMGPNASVLTGQFGSIGGIPVLYSSQLYKAQATGFVSLTPANNTFGQVVCVYLPYQRVGLRRRISPYLVRSDDGESWQLTITARIDYKTRPSNDSVSVIRNVLS